MPNETILAVDDNEQSRMVLEGNLASVGYGVLLASSGQEAVDKFKQHTPEMVLLDVVMPGIDGFETCRQIRLLPNGADVPIVFLTALTDIDSHKEALAAGGDDLLTKPIHRTELIMRVRSMLWMRRLRSELRSGYNLISSQRDTLIVAQKKKDELANFLVHDLKNPITNVLTSAAMLLEQPSVREDSTALQLTNHVLNAGRVIERMIMNLLDINKSEDGVLVPRIAQSDLTSLLEDVRKAVEPQARFRGIEVKTAIHNGLRAVYIDADLIHRTVDNLIANAMRFAPPASHITVEVKAVDGKSLELRVRDEGPGIPPDQRERIFEKYVRLEQDMPNLNHGLGLTFCRAAVEVHGGKIWAEDNPPRGACFCVSLPCLKPAK